MVDASKLERLYTVPLGKAYEHIRTKRTRRTVKILRKFLARHMKVKETLVKLSIALNNSMWVHGMQKPPRNVKIRAIKEQDLVHAYLSTEKIEDKKKETKKEGKKEEQKVESKTEVKTTSKEDKKEVKAESSVKKDVPVKITKEPKQEAPAKK
ncbi:MAG: 50S ribosomal protein L31e [Candidatus Micrarchaeota archaeon]|nr:50S ribosomal protein L31e [Candidatus Micrarchaeota archaeon]